MCIFLKFWHLSLGALHTYNTNKGISLHKNMFTFKRKRISIVDKAGHGICDERAHRTLEKNMVVMTNAKIVLTMLAQISPANRCQQATFISRKQLNPITYLTYSLVRLVVPNTEELISQPLEGL